MKMETNIVYQEDCIEGMKKIPSNSIDLVLTDPPYGITACEWDKPIDLRKFWVEIKRITKPNGVIVMTASQPFTTDLINSNREWFKYCLCWNKGTHSNPLLAKKQPLRIHEDIIIFYKKCFYNPQMEKGKPYKKDYGYKKHSTDSFGNLNLIDSDNKSGLRYPKSIINIGQPKNNRKFNHPTQKPVELFKYLIKSYSNENQIVLDCFGGSGTTAIACMETNREYICFENNPQYFKIINDRIKSAKSQTLNPTDSTLLKAEGFNISLKDNSNELSQISSNDETSLNNNIRRNI